MQINFSQYRERRDAIVLRLFDLHGLQIPAATPRGKLDLRAHLVPAAEVA
jgi:hypothetical protein